MNCIALDQGAGKSSVNTTVEHSPTLATTHQGEPCIALDGDKLKPRTDQRKGGNGFGINEEGAGYTLTAVDRHGVAYGIGHGGQGGSVMPSEEMQPTLVKDDHKGPMPAVVQCYENHAQDSRIKPIEVSDTRNQKDGTGGNNLPLVVSTNSNGEDVAPTVNANMSKLGGDNQTTFGGGGYCITRRIDI